MRGIYYKILGCRYRKMKHKLEQERLILNHMVIELSEKGEPLVENKELLAQNKKVDDILVQVIKLQKRILGSGKKDHHL